MDDFDEFSVLEYARSHGIARNHQQLNPLDLLVQIRDSEHAQSLSSTESTQILDFETLGFANYPSTFASKNEKLVLDKDGVKFLTSVLQEVTSLEAKPDHRAEDSIALKLKYKPRDDLKIDVPLLSAEKKATLKELTKRVDPVELLNKIVPDLADRERASIDEGLEFPDYFWELPSMLDRDPSMEKLEAPEGTGRVLREALTYLNEKSHRKDVEEFINSSILNLASSSQLATPPLYIESNEKHKHRVESESRNTDTGLNEATVEEAVTPGLLEEDDQPVRDALYTENEEQGEHNSILNSPHSDTGIGLNVALVEHDIIPERVRVHNSHVGDAISKKRAASSLSIHEPEDVAGKLPGSRTALSPATNPPGSLGTLSAFMQTRCHKNKRRKLDHESRYFNSTPKSSTKSHPAKADTPEKPADSTKLSSSPIATHNIQSLNLYPKYHSKESNKPLLLIMSTQLLRSDSALVRSLEDISSPRSVRLIFRDYQGANSSQLQLINEADLIVSPTIGIILASSHETTQKYLPGQGPPGIDSPLHARIVQATPRYEMLYVLVRSPLETSMNILSSVRDLTNYCMSLNHICNIRVLLIAADDVLEWILSIAAKHTTDPGLAPPLNGKESRTSVPHFHDDQTQWEVFLRSAGLNPFAAQSVLAVLKTSPAQPGRSEDVNQASTLSRFVEMPCRARRDMFRKLIGQRVFSRVNKTLETDWQVDWAVNLT
ncbi:Hypothetical protein PENO1_038100 [Penicillium occitanis (nom. inval.)]|nr:Hypothetical protein PENO1_038100 [Penicillium occitanis (nom. inval.)]PCH03248.1 hypothetical protein PENOC_039420 [Penicillium occitanis (nom. inval.)]